jgi:dihydrofolate synthase/folylpolyglutamate synthase
LKNKSSFVTFLEQKPLFYNEIDYTRMPRVYKKLHPYFTTPKIIHVVGTNGKGTTGRFIAAAIKSQGKTVGHYTSPHIMRFHERIWINGSDADDKVLEEAHRWLLEHLTKEEALSLSYFEYTTLLAMRCFCDCEYVVLEAGLGGEYDATAVFDATLSVVTVIDKDHEAFLGNTIEEIATTKLNAMASVTLLAEQKYPEVVVIAQKIAKQKNSLLYLTQELLSTQAQKLLQTIALPKYLLKNLSTALCALDLLGIAYSKKSFANAQLFGRLSLIEPNIYVDVGHNPLAAQAIAEYLQPQKYIVIYNSFKDKAYTSVLKNLQEIIEHVEIIDIQDDRIVPKEILQNSLKQLKIQYKDFQAIDTEKKYLVFGSFRVVEEFLKKFYE